MCGPSLPQILHILLTILTIAWPVTATSTASSLSYEDREVGPDPTTPSEGPPESNTAGADSEDFIWHQPVTVQLGVGFMVGCFLGAILYGVTRITMMLIRRPAVRTGERTTTAREREEEMEEAVLVDV